MGGGVIMPIAINGSGTITGISAGGLPDASVVTADIADGAVTQAKRSEQLTLETAKSATGTEVDFTGIPSWVKRVTVMFDGVSTNGTSGIRVQIGTSSGPETSGYNGATVRTASSYLDTVAISSGFDIGNLGAQTEVQNGQFVLSLFQASSNTWSCAGMLGAGLITNSTAGVKSLASALTQVRITTVGGTNTFDAGTINIMYE